MSYIKWKDKNSNEIEGLLICQLPSISKPKMKTEISKINGRSGDLIEDLGYESYVKTVGIGLTRKYNLDQIMNYFDGEGELICSSEPDKVYRCKIIDKIDYDRLINFRTASVKFYTQPYKYLVNEEEYDLSITTEESLEVDNKGLVESKPIITIYGTGTIGMSINDNQIFIYTFPEDENEVIIDCIEEEAYLDKVYKNRNMIGEFPTFKPSINIITWTGDLTRIKVHPKSRWI